MKTVGSGYFRSVFILTKDTHAIEGVLEIIRSPSMTGTTPWPLWNIRAWGFKENEEKPRGNLCRAGLEPRPRGSTKRLPPQSSRVGSYDSLVILSRFLASYRIIRCCPQMRMFVYLDLRINGNAWSVVRERWSFFLQEMKTKCFSS
jgi:hypothetical protein